MTKQPVLISIDDARRIFFHENSDFYPEIERIKIAESLKRYWRSMLYLR
jgi:hypothetical protein